MNMEEKKKFNISDKEFDAYVKENGKYTVPLLGDAIVYRKNKTIEVYYEKDVGFMKKITVNKGDLIILLDRVNELIEYNAQLYIGDLKK
jgi:signal peptidase I